MSIKTIRIYAKDNCPDCGGAGYVILSKEDESRVPCTCITSQIPTETPPETDFMILPATYQNKAHE